MNLVTRGLGRSRQLLATGGIGRVVLIVLRGGDSSKRGLDTSMDALLVREDNEILAIIISISSGRER